MIKNYFDSRSGWLLLLLLAGALVSCNTDHNSTSRLEVRLTDAPGDYQEVNIDIQDIQLNAEDGNGSGGWQS
jgi:hypothetical protein